MSNKNRDKSQNIEVFGYVYFVQNDTSLSEEPTSRRDKNVRKFKKVPITENFMREELINLNSGTIFEDTSKPLPITF